MMILGADPGVDGGLVVMEGGRIVDQVVMPTIGKKTRQIDVPEIIAWLLQFRRIDMTILEQSQALPKIGGRGPSAASSFRFGANFGDLRGCFSALGVAAGERFGGLMQTRPKEWQKTMHEGCPTGLKPKERSLLIATRLFPGHDFRRSERCKNPHDGLIDAALLAHWGWQRFGAAAA